MQVMIQLAFNGQCRAAFGYYAKVLHGEIRVMNSLGATQDIPLPPGSKSGKPELIHFAQLAIGDQMLQGNDVPVADFEEMRGFNVALHVNDAAEARRIVDEFALEGEINTPLSDVAWSSAFGIVRDKFGVPWLILATDKPRQS